MLLPHRPRGKPPDTQIPLVIRSDNVDKAIFSTRTQGRRVIIRRMQVDEQIPHQYREFADVFSDKESKRYPLKRPWDHKIKLKPGTPAMLISKMIHLSHTEQKELKEFINEHLEQGTIQRSKSPYAASFFFIKKKNRK